MPAHVNDILVVRSEDDLLALFILLVFKIDPDIVASYDVEKTSLNYLATRSWGKNIDIFNFISRSPKDIDCMFEFIQFEDFVCQNDEYSIFSSNTLKQTLNLSVDNEEKYQFHQNINL